MRKIKKKLLKRIHSISVPFLAYILKAFLKFVLSTSHVQFKGLEKFTSVASKKQGCILMLWHNRLVLTAEILSKYSFPFKFTALISSSLDARILVHIANSYNNASALIVTPDERRHALRRFIHLLKEGNEIFLITPDGPNGPVYKVKGGIALAAKKASANIVPFTWKTNRFWQLNTWDKLIFPKPFSKITISFGDPISLAPNNDLSTDKAILESALSSLESQM